MKKFTFTLLLLFSSNFAFANAYIKISDMSLLDYQIINEKVYLRNLNTFDSSYQGCCYSYYIDLTKTTGLMAWATMLTKIATKESYVIGLQSKAHDSEVTYSGQWPAPN